MKKLLYLVIALVAFASSPAISADLTPAAFTPPPPPPLVPAYSWTGCYVGGNGGAAFSTWTWANPTDNPTVPGTRGQVSVNDVVFGGQVGCDYQVGGLVLGVQGMFDWSPHLEGRFFDAVTNQFNQFAQTRWFATATGRVGVTVTPQALVYAKGGAAWARNNYQDIQVGWRPSDRLQNIEANTNATRLGWTVGIGLEYMFAPNWSVFVEYDYLDFGTASVFFGFPAGSIPPSNTYQITQHIQAILAGINFRFNFSGDTVVAARY